MPVYDERFSKTRQLDALEQDRAMAAEAMRMEWVKPLILTGIALPILLIMLASKGGEYIIAYLMLLGISLPLGVIALWVASAVLAGGAGPLGLACVRLLAVFAISDLALVIFGMTGCLAIVISAAVHVFLIMLLFDFETLEACIVWIVVFGMKFGIALLLDGVG